MENKRKLWGFKNIIFLILVFVLIGFIIFLGVLSVQDQFEFSFNDKDSKEKVFEDQDIILNLDNPNLVFNVNGSSTLVLKIGDEQYELVKKIEKNDDVKVLSIENDIEAVSQIDSDADGLSNVEEEKYGTNSNKQDSDDDGYSDYEEIMNGYNPLGPGTLKIENEVNNNLLNIDSLINEAESSGVTSDKKGTFFSSAQKSVTDMFSGVTSFVKKNIFKQEEVVTAASLATFLGLTEDAFKNFIEKNQVKELGFINEIKKNEAVSVEKLKNIFGEDLKLTNSEFIWPAQNKKVKYSFKDENYPFKDVKELSGIVMPMKQGSKVVAANSGYVAKAQSSNEGEYNYILIVHGDNFSTVYGHLSRIDVREGDRVIQGETIGLSGGEPQTVGAGELSLEPQLYFELRKDGEAIDPLLYLE